MRRIEDRYMTLSKADADAIAARHCARYCGPYEGSATVEAVPELPGPYTHRVTVSRWNSCD